jgi:tRNA(Ile)-lysidine synthase
MHFVDKVKQSIRRERLFEKGERIVIGFSGGGDSTALLEVLSLLKEDYGLTLVPAHLHHGFRGEEADEDLRFCREAAERHGLELAWERVDGPALAREQGLSAQEAAREARYDFLIRTAVACGASRIALGHHADDQAETLLMRLLRGAGTRGLTGMPPQRKPGIIRPLLKLRRSEILDFLRGRGVAFRQDSSNEKDIYLRNRIRRELMPLLVEQYSANLTETLCRTAEILREDEACLDAAARAHFRPETIAGGIALDAATVSGLPPALGRRVLRLAIEAAGSGLAGITFRHVDAVMDLLHAEGSAARIHLPRGLTVGKVYGRLEFKRGKDVSHGFEVFGIPVPGRERIAPLGIHVVSEIVPASAVATAPAPDTVALDLEKCALPLAVRTRTAGDVFYPAGFGKRKKIKRFFIDQKIPWARRDRVPLFVDRYDEIVWVGGYRADARFAADAATSRVLLLKIVDRKGGDDDRPR